MRPNRPHIPSTFQSFKERGHKTNSTPNFGLICRLASRYSLRAFHPASRFRRPHLCVSSVFGEALSRPGRPKPARGKNASCDEFLSDPRKQGIFTVAALSPTRRSRCPQAGPNLAAVILPLFQANPGAEWVIRPPAMVRAIPILPRLIRRNRLDVAVQQHQIRRQPRHQRARSAPPYARPRRRPPYRRKGCPSAPTARPPPPHRAPGSAPPAGPASPRHPSPASRWHRPPARPDRPDAAPQIGVVPAVAADHRLHRRHREIHRARRMRRLQAGDDPQRADARDVGLVDQFDMLDPVAQVAVAVVTRAAS